MLKGSFEHIDQMVADNDPCLDCRLKGLSLCIEECINKELYTPIE